jgi:hypothetical protein
MDTVVDLDEEALMSRMISLLLNYPSIAYENDTVEVRVRKIEKSQVLLELIHLAEMNEDISQEDLIKPFENKTPIYNRLKELCTLVPYLSETQARDEFLSALTAAEKCQESTKIKGEISSSDTLEAQQKIMKGIQEGTYNNIEDELVDPDKPPLPLLWDEPDEPDEPDELDEPVERYVTEGWALGRIKDEKEWADARVKDAKEDVEKEANRGFIAFLLVGLMILLFLSAM